MNREDPTMSAPQAVAEAKLNFTAIVDTTDPSAFAVETKADGPAGCAAADRRDAPRLALGRPVRPEPERRHGLDAGRGRPRPVPDPQHAGRPARRPTARRSRWAITPGTGRSACSCRRRPRSCSGSAWSPFAGMVSDPCDGRTQGTAGHDGQPALSQRRGDRLPPADPLAARGARACSASPPATRACRR